MSERGPLAVVLDPRFEAPALVAHARAAAGGEPVIGIVADPEGIGRSQPSMDVDRTVTLDGNGMPGADAESLAAALEHACRHEDAELLGLPSSVHWREVGALVAARLGGAVTSEVTGIRREADGGWLADRLFYSGLVVATVALLARPAVVMFAVPEAGDVAVRMFAAESGETAEGGRRLLVSRVPRDVGPGAEGAAAGLAGARCVVAVGRGLQRREDLALVEALCRALDAELAGSRPLIEDLRWLPADRQVGLSGQTVRPELYLAVGISGQIQHLVGMRDAGVVVAINADAKAPIFDAADVGVVGDLYEVVPRLADAVAARGAGS